jgi:hypothetical protein
VAFASFAWTSKRTIHAALVVLLYLIMSELSLTVVTLSQAFMLQISHSQFVVVLNIFFGK